MNSKQIGELSEAEILLRFLRKGISVSIPHGDNQRYDFIIDCDNKLYKIQVKTGRINNDCVVFDTCSSQIHRDNGKQGYRGQIDYFAVYCPVIDKAYLISVNDVGERACRLRLQPTKNNNAKLVNFAVDHEFDLQLELLITANK